MKTKMLETKNVKKDFFVEGLERLINCIQEDSLRIQQELIDFEKYGELFCHSIHYYNPFCHWFYKKLKQGTYDSRENILKLKKAVKNNLKIILDSYSTSKYDSTLTYLDRVASLGTLSAKIDPKDKELNKFARFFDLDYIWFTWPFIAYLKGICYEKSGYFEKAVDRYIYTYQHIISERTEMGDQKNPIEESIKDCAFSISDPKVINNIIKKLKLAGNKCNNREFRYLYDLVEELKEYKNSLETLDESKQNNNSAQDECVQPQRKPYSFQKALNELVDVGNLDIVLCFRNAWHYLRNNLSK